MRPASLLALVLVAAPAAVGCGNSGCDGTNAGSEAHAPIIRGVEVVNQEKSNPWTLVCGLDFVAGANNLAGGNLLLYSSGSTAPDMTQELSAVLMASQLPFDSGAGRMGFTVPFQASVLDGQKVRLGVQLEAAAASAGAKAPRSNCYQLDLLFSVRANAAGAAGAIAGVLAKAVGATP